MANFHNDDDLPPLSMPPKGTGRLTMDDLHAQDEAHTVSINAAPVNHGPAAASFLDQKSDTVDVDFHPIEQPVSHDAPVSATAAPSPAVRKPIEVNVIALAAAGLFVLAGAMTFANWSGHGRSSPVAVTAPVHIAPLAPSEPQESLAVVEVASAPAVASVASSVAVPDPVAVVVSAKQPEAVKPVASVAPVVRKKRPRETVAPMVVARASERYMANDADTERYRAINYALGFELKKP